MQLTMPARVKYFSEKALAYIGTLKTASNAQINEFLDSLTETISPASRNRGQMALSGFYRWMRTRGYVTKHYNPMEGIKQEREERTAEGIIIWEEKEIPALLKVADSLRDGIAVWVAIHAGLRRGEIARLEWTDVTPAFLLVRKSKTGLPRQVPLSKILAERLAKEPRQGLRVVPWPEAFFGWETAAGRLIYEYLPIRLEVLHQKHPEKFGWNPFRHTFASRHAQAGTPIDVIAAWLGDSPAVCKKHYARYVPANMRDARIDIVDEPAKKPRVKKVHTKTPKK